MAVISTLPHVNAILNACAAVFLLAGFIFIRRGRRDLHRASMITAAVISGVFLVSYVTLRLFAPIFAFPGEGIIRPIYFTILATHVVLAIVMAPMVLLALFRALRGDFEAHRRIARKTWPIWMYVSLTGIFVYVMLYRVYAPDVAALAS